MLIVYFKLLEQAGQLGGAEESIDLRDLCLEVVLVALREAAGHVELFDLAFAFGLGVLHDGIDRFLLGAVYEAAGIDHYYIAAFAPFVVHDVVAAIGEMRHHDLAIDEVLGTAEGDD
jgi:hypothetical protein